MIVYDLEEGGRPWRGTEERMAGRRRMGDGVYMHYDPYFEEERRMRREEMRRYRDEGRRRPVGYVNYPMDGYAGDDIYEGDFRIVRGRDY